jgi:N-carbamoyl-L-amino-acid hydrolase
MTRGLCIDIGLAERLFDELRERTSDAPGVTRAAYSTEEEIAHEVMRRTARGLGLAIDMDAAGNLYLTLPGRNPSWPRWIVGSHLDSVPHGGNFDGAAGVIAGIGAVAALQAADVRPDRPVTVMAIRAEESNWFPISYLGSRAAFGLLPAAAFDTPRADSGRALRDHMADLGLRPEEVAAGKAFLAPSGVHAFIELHIEQGPVLEAEELPIGLVTGISGSFRYRNARCLGTYGHSGAVPRAYRHDAVFAFADLVAALDAAWADLLATGQQATVTFGQVATDPDLHAFSKVPGDVSFCIDVRSPDPDCLAAVQARLAEIVAAIEVGRGVRFVLGERTGSTPARLDRGLRASLAATASGLGVAYREMTSGAGHDTATFANAGVPAALIFVRKQNGSHNPDEAMRIEDFAVGANLIANRLAREGG